MAQLSQVALLKTHVDEAVAVPSRWVVESGCFVEASGGWEGWAGVRLGVPREPLAVGALWCQKPTEEVLDGSV